MIQDDKARQRDKYFASRPKTPVDPTPIPKGSSYSRVAVRGGKYYVSHFDWEMNCWTREIEFSRIIK